MPTLFFNGQSRCVPNNQSSIKATPREIAGRLVSPYYFFTVIVTVAFLPLAVLTVIFALPGLMALTTPLPDTVATFLLLLVQV